MVQAKTPIRDEEAYFRSLGLRVTRDIELKLVTCIPIALRTGTNYSANFQEAVTDAPHFLAEPQPEAVHEQPTADAEKKDEETPRLPAKSQKRCSGGSEYISGLIFRWNQPHSRGGQEEGDEKPKSPTSNQRSPSTMVLRRRFGLNDPLSPRSQFDGPRCCPFRAGNSKWCDQIRRVDVHGRLANAEQWVERSIRRLVRQIAMRNSLATPPAGCRSASLLRER